MAENKWTLKGLDTFENEYYPLGGEFENEEQALAAAAVCLANIKRTQPDEDSGGDDVGSIQDRVFVVRPDGTQYRYTA